MKYLQTNNLFLLNEQMEKLSGFKIKLELYTCKRTKTERKFARFFLKDKNILNKELAITHFTLISTLNIAFPDNDFSQIKISDFKETSIEKVVLDIEKILFFSQKEIALSFWGCLNREIDIKNSSIFCFDSITPIENRWSLNYIFYNKKRKRTFLFVIESEDKKLI